MRFFALLLLPGLASAAGPLDTDLADYLVLGQKTVALKNLEVAAPGCNVGVNCYRTAASPQCGRLQMKGASVAQPGQVVGDATCGRGAFWEVFRNNIGQCDPTLDMIANPGIAPDGSEPFVPPIVPNADLDGDPSCSDLCQVDRQDVAAACGVALPLPFCDALKPVVVSPDADCPPYDTTPGNFRCDLPPDRYGTITVLAAGSLAFNAGTHVACGLAAGTGARVTSFGDATVLVPGKGNVKLNNDGQHGCGCGRLRLIAERGTISLGKRGEVDADACSIDGTVRLGNSNALRGHFFGDRVRSDSGNVGHCCPAATAAAVSPAFTHPAEFYRRRPAVVQGILTGAGGSLAVCGRTLTNLNVDSASSVLEALCVPVDADNRLHLMKELTAAALNAAASGAVFADLALCSGICASGAATAVQIDDCVNRSRAFNCSGEHLPSVFEPSGPGDPVLLACGAATGNQCNALFGGACATP